MQGRRPPSPVTPKTFGGDLHYYGTTDLGADGSDAFLKGAFQPGRQAPSPSASGGRRLNAPYAGPGCNLWVDRLHCVGVSTLHVEDSQAAHDRCPVA